MNLSDVYSQIRTKSPEGNDKAYWFEDRDYCMHQLFWNLIRHLEKNKKSIVVCSDLEDLKGLNYLFSKYGLGALSLSLDKEIIQNQLRQLIEIKNIDALKRSSFPLSKKMEDNVNALKVAVNKLRLEKIGRKSVSDIVDMVNMPTLDSLEMDQMLLEPPYSYAAYQRLKALVEKAEQIYDIRFKDLKHFDPLSDERQLTVEAQIELVNEYLGRAESLSEAFDKQELRVKHLVVKDIDQELNQIEKIYSELTEMFMSSDFSETQKEKLLYQEKKLYELLTISSPPPTQLEEAYRCFEIIKTKYLERKSQNHIKIELAYSEFIKRLTVVNENFPELAPLRERLDSLATEIEKQALFKDFKITHSLNFYHLKSKLNGLIDLLNRTRHFYDSNTSYFEWKTFLNSVPQNEQILFEHLSTKDQFWEKAFEELFLAYFLNNRRSELSSVQKLMENLKYELTNPELKSELIHKIFNNYSDAYQHESVLSNQDWDQIFDTHSGLLQQRFPVLIIDQALSKKMLSKLLASTDALIYFNCLPKQSIKEDWLNVEAYGYNEFFRNRLAEDWTGDTKVFDETALRVQLDKTFHQMNRVERNRAARYLGHRLHQLNSGYRIYQNKAMSIISFWPDAKNARLLSFLEGQSLKEIVSDRTDTNLIPGIFSDEEKDIYMFIEDGLIQIEEPLDPFFQLSMLEELNQAGVKLIDVDNWALIIDRKEVFSKTFAKLNALQAYQGQVSAKA